MRWLSGLCPKLALASVMALGFLLGCGGEPDPGPGPEEETAEESPAGGGPGQRAGDLVPVPEPLLDPVEPAVRRQLQSLRRELEELEAGEGADPVVAAAAYGDLGLAYHAYELVDSAEAAYANARRLDPDSPLWAFAAGRLAQDYRGDLEAAEEAYRAALEASAQGDPLRLPIFVYLGRRYLAEGNLEAAREAYSSALRQLPEGAPGAAAAEDGLGRVAAAAGDDEEAARRFRRAWELEPEAGRVAYRLGQALRRLGRLEEAREMLAAQGPAEITLPDPFQERLAEAPSGASATLRRGALAQVAGRFSQAEALYREALALDPRSFGAHISLGAMAARHGKTAEAVALYRKAAELEPANALPPFNLGHLLIRSGELEEAAASFRRALELEPGHWEARLGLAAVAHRQGRHEEALSLYGELLAENPDSVPARSRRAVVLAESGRQEEAREALEELVQKAPGEAEPHLHLGTLLARMGRMEEAREALETVLRLEAPPEMEAQARRLLAGIEGAGSSPGATAEDLRAAAEAAPRDPAARRRLAGDLARRGRYGEAAEQYGILVDLLPGDTQARLAEATALLLDRRYGQARRRLEEAVRAAPDDPARALALARVLAAAPDPGVRDGERALPVALAVHETVKSLDSGETVAMAYAAAGRFEEAKEWQRRLVQEAARLGDANLESRFRADLARYEAGRPARNPWAVD